MIQGLVNSFGVSAMAAFAAVVKIESFAYMPVQDFGNAFSTFIAQNMGGRKAKAYLYRNTLCSENNNHLLCFDFRSYIDVCKTFDVHFY